MLYTPNLASHFLRYDNWGTNPSATPGTSVTSGNSNAEGTYTQIASSANIAQDVYGMEIRVSDNSGTGAQNHLMDIGVDPAGGTSYSAIISNIVCGGAPAITAAPFGGHHFTFPMFIKAGSSVAVRIQGSNATAGTLRVSAVFYMYPSRPEAFPVGSFSETIGTITDSSGTSVTPGNAADGSWASLGTTTNPLWWWQIAHQVNNATVTAEYTFIDLAYGDGSNKHIIMRDMHAGTTAEKVGRAFASNNNFFECYAPVPAGATIYARMKCNNAPDTGYNMVAIGIGG
jgi:hypothetical protein